MFLDEIRRQAENAPHAALPAVTSALWRAFAEGHVTEAEAGSLSALIEARQLSDVRHRSGQIPNPTGTSTAPTTDTRQDRQNGLRAGVGSRPRSDASLERRRRWAASGRLPPALAARFTLAEQATLALIAAETARRGDCRLSISHLAAVAGVAETTVRNAIREARKLGLLTVEERRVTGWRNNTNIIRVVSPEWAAWLRLKRQDVLRFPEGQGQGRRGGGCKSPNRTPTKVPNQGKTRIAKTSQGRAANPKSPSLTMSVKAGA